MRTLRSAGTIRSNLTKILIGAMVPMVFLGAWQGILTYEDSRNLIAERLRANAWAIAESERDPFIIARHSLQMVTQLDAVKEIGPGCDQLMVDARDGATGILNFLRADRNGTVRCSGIPFRPGTSIGQNPWFQRARSSDGFTLGGPVVGEITKRSVVLVLLPIRTDRGRFDGTISAAISMERLATALATRQRRSGGAVLLVNRAGEVINSAGPSQFTRLPSVAAALETPQMATSTDGKEWTFVTAPMFDRDLLIAYAEPRANFANAAISRIWLILALPLLAMVLSLAGIWFATQRYLLDWFPRLRGLTQQIAEEQPVPDNGTFDAAPTEIAGIADDLHSMAGTLSLSRAALHKAIETQRALTRELNHRVRNNIQIIVSLLTMQASKAEESGVREIIDQARARVSAIGLVHRFMYDQDEGRLGEVAAARLLGELCNQIRSAGRRASELELTIDADAHCQVSFDNAVPLLLFALEAIGESTRRSNMVEVQLHSENEGCRLEVREASSGSGTPAGDCELLGALAEQMGGQFGAETTATGSTTWLAFPTR